MEKKYTDTKRDNKKDTSNKEVIESDDEVDYDEMVSHKIDKNVVDKKNKKKLIVILEHA